LDGRVEAFDGPSIGYQGDLIVNPIFSPQPKDGLSPGRVHGWYNAFYSVSVDAVPSASSSVTLANAAQLSSTANGLATGLITAVTGGTANVPWNCPGVPIQPLAGGAVVTCIAMDFGFSTGTTTANSSTIVVTDNRQFTLGQWLCLPGCGGTTTTPLFCQVMAFGTASPANATTLQVSPSPQTGLNNAPIGQANLYSQFLPYATQFGPSAPMPTATEPYRSAGLGAAMDPWASVARNLQYVSGAASGTGVIMVTGYDIYGQLMTEKVTLNSATPVRGLKAFKYIQSVQTITAATTGVATVSIGPDNSVGMNLRSDRWEFADIFYNGGFAINSQGWTAAVTTPATSTSGDVRGMINASTVLVGSSSGSAALGGPFDGVKRITIFQNVQLQNAIGATPLNYTSLIGVAQSIGT
jgi:hypothetical protein